jgi:mannose-1-phosphate guanylyltransferase
MQNAFSQDLPHGSDLLTPHPWVVVLAGGRGNRLADVATALYGYARPKQFCSFGGPSTLLQQTILRARRVAPEHRIVVVTTATHRREALQDLEAFPDVRWVEQPQDRGTLPGILLPLLSILEQARNAPVYVLPSDHWVDDDHAFMATFQRAGARCFGYPGEVVLLGSRLDGPSDGYGWIVPLPGKGCQRVASFVEKPSRAEVPPLLARGALVNTFGMVGTGEAFSSMLRRAAPTWWSSLAASHHNPEALAQTYDLLRPRDFSRDVLQKQTERLRVMPLEGVRWSDVGTPERLAVMQPLADVAIV